MTVESVVLDGPDFLKSVENCWETDLGAWFPGERVVFRGHDLFSELSETPWMELLIYGITGKRFNVKQIKLFEAIWVICTSYPDPRLWNNRVAALAGTTKSPACLACGAATAVTGATLYGGRPIIQSNDLLHRMKAKVTAGQNLVDAVFGELKKYRGLPGYGRPLVRGDERIEVLLEAYSALGFEEGEFVKLAFDIEDILLKGRRRLKMNIATLSTAMIAEQGMTPRECSNYLTLCFSAGIFACYVDTSKRKSGSFFPFRCSRIEYSGPTGLLWESG